MLNQHDGFALKPKKLIERFKENPNPSSDAAARLFVHMTNHVANEHCIAVKNASKGQHVDLQPTAVLDFAIFNSQRGFLNPTPRDMVISDVMDQVRGKRAKKKEATCK